MKLFDFSWRDVVMGTLGAVAMAFMVSSAGCTKQVLSSSEAEPLVKMPGEYIDRDVRRIDDPERGVSCYVYAPANNFVHHRFACAPSKD